MVALVSEVAPKAEGALCHECPLKDQPCVPTKKARKFPVKGAVVSRSPGEAEVRAGEPMSSQYGSGKIIDHLFKMNVVTRDELIITNTVLCVAPDGLVPPAAIKACSGRLAQ